jgi:hypothetical protein
MNPADRQYSLSIDDLHQQPQASATCELCGQPVSECMHTDDGAICEGHAEALWRLCEFALWADMTNKGVGTMIRVLAARVLNPTASMRAIAAAVGCTHLTVYRAIRSAKQSIPAIHAALWRDNDA